MAGKADAVLLAAVCCLLLGVPLGEGSAAPGALFMAQSAILVVGVSALLLPSRKTSWSEPGGKLLLAAVGCLGLACVSALGTAYPYASYLRILDLVLYVAL